MRQQSPPSIKIIISCLSLPETKHERGTILELELEVWDDRNKSRCGDHLISTQSISNSPSVHPRAEKALKLETHRSYNGGRMFDAIASGACQRFFGQKGAWPPFPPMWKHGNKGQTVSDTVSPSSALPLLFAHEGSL